MVLACTDWPVKEGKGGVGWWAIFFLTSQGSDGVDHQT